MKRGQVSARMGGVCALVGATAWAVMALHNLVTGAPWGVLFVIAPVFFGSAVLGFGIAGPYVGLSRWRYAVVVTAGVVATALGLLGATDSLFDALRSSFGLGGVNSPALALLGSPGLAAFLVTHLLGFPFEYFVLDGLEVVLSLVVSTGGVLVLGWPRGSQLASGVRRAVVAGSVTFFMAQSVWNARTPVTELHASVILVPLAVAWAWIGWHGASLRHRGTPPAAPARSA